MLVRIFGLGRDRQHHDGPLLRNFGENAHNAIVVEFHVNQERAIGVVAQVFPNLVVSVRIFLTIRLAAAPETGRAVWRSE
jgi:hypothetical protein